MIERKEDLERELDYRQSMLITVVRQALGNKRAAITDLFPRLERFKRKRSGNGSFSTLKANLLARNEALKAKNGG